VAFNNPPALPDPAGLSSALGALASGAMFRDMSGSSTTQALALAALTGAGQGATAAGQQGVANAAMAAQKDIEMAKIAAGLVTGGLAGGGGASTVSEKGAKINEGRSLDERGAPANAADDAKATESHEVAAADGDTGRALQLIGSIAKSATGEPAAGDGAGTPPVEEAPASAASGSSSTPTPAPPRKRAPASKATRSR
jgi:hypothetical protein